MGASTPFVSLLFLLVLLLSLKSELSFTLERHIYKNFQNHSNNKHLTSFPHNCSLVFIFCLERRSISHFSQVEELNKKQMMIKQNFKTIFLNIHYIFHMKGLLASELNCTNQY